ncbi:MAG: MBL fold metallo-hydrolase [Clostridia bacterium]|nr:MBL fold metallo-hydrolase [Clostridia bacterium]
MGSRYKFSVDISVKNRAVTGSCIMVTAHRVEGDIKFLVDCGIYQGEEGYEEKNYAKFDFKPENLDFLLITHVHADHSGRVPLLFKRGFYQKAYCTEDTYSLLKYALPDDAKIIGINAKRNNVKPLYDDNDVDCALRRTESKPFEETFEPHEGVKVTFFKNAHLIGATTILVQISSYSNEDINLLFLGDYNTKNMFFDVAELPDWVRDLPLHVICESTYGHVDSKDVRVPVFQDNISKWVNMGKKTIVIPTLSLGRYQEIAYVLKEMQNKKLLSPSIPIRFDGCLAIKYTNAYKNILHISPEKKDFMPFNSSFVTERADVIGYRDQQIIVTTSGGGNFGPAPDYVNAFIERKDAGFHFTSYLWEESLGRNMLEAEKGSFVQVGSVLKKIVADVATTSEYSGHATRDQLLDFLKTLKNIRSLEVTHGEPDVREAFGQYCKRNLDLHDVVITGTGYTIRLNTYGIVKTVPEKPLII